MGIKDVAQVIAAGQAEITTQKSFSFIPAWAAEHNNRLGEDAPIVDLYARLSKNPDGKLEKIGFQLQDARHVLERHGWRVGLAHVDNSLSAWNRGVWRAAWEHLISRLTSRATGGVVGYHSDRLMRRPDDLQRLINLADEHGLLLATRYGQWDLTDPNERYIARIEVAQAERASGETSRRIRDNFAKRRENGGRKTASRAFGFPGVDRFTPRTPDDEFNYASAELVEAERAGMTWAAQKIIDGGVEQLQGEVCAGLNDRGLTTTTGRAWTPRALKQMLTSPRNAGLIEFDGVVVGEAVSPKDPPLDRETYDQMMAVFVARRRGRPTPARLYVGSGLIHCGLCGRQLSGRPQYRNGKVVSYEYHCHIEGGCARISVTVKHMDNELRSLVILRLGDANFTRRLAEQASKTAVRVHEVNSQLAEAEATRQAMSAKVGHGELDWSDFEAFIRPLNARIARLTAERDVLAQEQLVGSAKPEMSTAAEVADQWDGNGSPSVRDQRTMLRTALIGIRVLVMPHTEKGSRTFDKRRVVIQPVVDSGAEPDRGAPQVQQRLRPAG